MIKSLSTINERICLVALGRASVFPGEYWEPRDLMEEGGGSLSDGVGEKSPFADL